MIDDMRTNLGFRHKYEERDLDDWRAMGIERGARFMAIRVDTFNGEIFVKFMTWLHELPEDGGDSYALGTDLNDCEKTIGVVELDASDFLAPALVQKPSSRLATTIRGLCGGSNPISKTLQRRTHPLTYVGPVSPFAEFD